MTENDVEFIKGVLVGFGAIALFLVVLVQFAKFLNKRNHV